jgi:hypothetical protein
MDSCFKTAERVGDMDWHSLLGNHWTIVNAFIGHKMHHDSGLAASALCELGECALDGMSAWQLAWESWMNVDDLIGELRKKSIGQYAHESSKHNDVGLPRTNDLCKARVVLLASLMRFCGNNCCLDVVALRAIQRKRLMLVGNNSNYLGVNLPTPTGIDDGLQVGAVAGRKNHKPRGHESKTRLV